MFPSVSSIPTVIVFAEFRFPLLSIIPTFNVPSALTSPAGSAIDIGPLYVYPFGSPSAPNCSKPSNTSSYL